MSELVFLLPCGAKARYTLEVANHTSGVIHILAVALWALKECTLIYMVTFVAYCDTNVETEVVTTCQCRCVEQLEKAFLVGRFLQVQV